jgi:hypothetical protein
MQHLISNYRGEDVEHEAATADRRKALDALLVRQDRNSLSASRAYLSMGLAQLLRVVIFFIVPGLPAQAATISIHR